MWLALEGSGSLVFGYPRQCIFRAIKLMAGQARPLSNVKILSAGPSPSMITYVAGVVSRCPPNAIPDYLLSHINDGNRSLMVSWVGSHC